MKILILDNFDSFTFNLYHYCEQFCSEVTVKRNNEITLEDIGKFEKIILSPGPGLPKDAGITNKVIERYHPEKSILGVCLGMQAMGEVFGGSLKNLPAVLHGKTSELIIEKDDLLFKGLPQKFQIGHYHSWAIDQVPQDFEVIATNATGLIMAFRHKKCDLRAVQFHPESVLTHHGLQLIQNWIHS